MVQGLLADLSAIHDVDERWVRDLPILGADTQLVVHRVRMRCPACRPNWATQFRREWKARAMHSAIELLKRFTRRLAQKLDGLLSPCEFPLHTSLLEGINNKINVIKRLAYGFRDGDYLFLKIRAAFPGFGDEP